MKRQLILENGDVFIGEGFGANVDTSGEVVFQTSMTAYQEAITDPSNCGQIITFTVPLVGNYGMTRDDDEAIQPAIHGVIVKEYEREPSHWRSTESLDSYLKRHRIPGLAGIDTRKLMRLLGTSGPLRGKLCSLEEDVDRAVQELRNASFEHPVRRVSTKEPYRIPGKGRRVVIVDFGMKQSILQPLIERGCDIIVVPFDSTKDEIFRYDPDGVILTNGPGKAEALEDTINTVKQLLGRVPIFGISLGQQLLGLACGAATERLQSDHRGASYPVRDLKSDRVIMTKQNHRYALKRDTLEAANLRLTHVALNDRTVEGIEHQTFKAFGVQFIPDRYEGNSLYDHFLTMMERRGES